MDAQKIRESDWWQNLVAGFFIAAGGYAFWRLIGLIETEEADAELGEAEEYEAFEEG